MFAMKKNIILLIFICLVVGTIDAQSTHKLLRDGNDSYEQKDYVGAAENYYKALEKDPSNLKGQLFLVNAIKGCSANHSTRTKAAATTATKRK